jgi:Adenine deaminase
VTVSSDAGGSIPGGDRANAQALYDDIVGCIRAGVAPESAFSLATENVAKLLKLYPKKGVLAEGGDADILITDGEFNLKALFCLGRPLVENL